MKIAAYQLLTGPDVQLNLEQVILGIEKAVDLGVQILAFPEGCLFGYCCSQDYWDQMHPSIFKEAEDRISKLCLKYRIAIVIGSASFENGGWYNDLAIFDSDGVLKHRYAKTFLAGEKWCKNSQKKIPVVDLSGVPCSFIICHDIRYPELVRLPAAMGAQICIFCSCESNLLDEHKLSAYRAMPISRATESGIYLLMANTPGNPLNLADPGSSHGNSKIVDPDGNVILEAGYFENRLVMADIDLNRSTGWVSKRVLKERTQLQEWFYKGVSELVEKI